MPKKNPRADQIRQILAEYTSGQVSKASVAEKYGYDYGNWFGEDECVEFEAALRYILMKYPSAAVHTLIPLTTALHAPATPMAV